MDNKNQAVIKYNDYKEAKGKGVKTNYCFKTLIDNRKTLGELKKIIAEKVLQTKIIDIFRLI